MFTLRNVALTVLMLSAFAVGSAAAVRADTIVFTSQTDFFGAASNLSTETFDQIPARTLIGVGSATIGGVTYTAQNPLAEWRVIAVSVPPSPPNYFGTVNNPGTFELLTFGEGAATNAAGFFLLGGDFPTPAYRIVVTMVGGSTLTEDVFVSGPSIYRGFLSEEGISSILIERRDFQGGNSNIFFDDVSRGTINAVPEPATMLLLGAGLAGVALKTRRRRRGKEL